GAGRGPLPARAARGGRDPRARGGADPRVRPGAAGWPRVAGPQAPSISRSAGVSPSTSTGTSGRRNRSGGTRNPRSASCGAGWGGAGSAGGWGRGPAREAGRGWRAAGGWASGAEPLPQRRGEPLDLDRDVGPAEPLRRDEESLLLLVRAGQGRDLRAVVDVAAGAGDTVGPGVAEHGGGLGAQRPEVVEGEHEHRLAHELAVPVAVRVQGEPGAGADGAPLGEAQRGDVLAADQVPARPDAERQRPVLGPDAAAQAPLEAQRLAHTGLRLGAVPGEDVRGV